MVWFKGDDPIEQRRRHFFRTGKIVSTLFIVGGSIAAGQTFYAVHTGAVWRDYRGEIIGDKEMYGQCLLFLGVAVLGLVMFIGLSKWARRHGL